MKMLNKLALITYILLCYTEIYAKDLSISQIEVIQKCKEFGTTYNLGNTLAGICYIESKGGIYKINATTQDYGITGINIKSALRRLQQKNTWHNRNVVATKLVENDELALSLSILELLYWRDKRGRTYWASMVESYNKGNKHNNFNYANKIAKAIKYLKQQKIL